jgi:hypothetical protein
MPLNQRGVSGIIALDGHNSVDDHSLYRESQQLGYY